ncbi:MAG: hypothetical protein M1824_004365 [Vezdaea acicularis]|nr:MAG: hypothetical protein M1824_004365 [Vezdaea acicularis]
MGENVRNHGDAESGDIGPARSPPTSPPISSLEPTVDSRRLPDEERQVQFLNSHDSSFSSSQRSPHDGSPNSEKVAAKGSPSEPSIRQRKGPRRAKTNYEDVEVEDRHFSHKYMIRRPRALQYTLHGRLIRLASNTPSEHGSSHGGGGGGSDTSLRSTDNAATQRARLDLFIDLIWVGIIGNIAEHYSTQAFDAESKVSAGHALLEYLVLLLPAVRIWNALRDFLNHFYVDDMLQRWFVNWVLVVMFAFGNNAPYLLGSSADATDLSHPAAHTTGALVISLYLIARASFLLIEAAYSIAIPWLRRHVRAQWLVSIPSSAMWVAGLFLPWPGSAGLWLGAIIVEFCSSAFLASPYADRLLHQGYRKADDDTHMVERVGSFFIIVVGSGVFLLINKSPTGPGLNTRLASGVFSVLILYVLTWLYFNGGQEKRFVHAVRRVWWRKAAWYTLHIPLISSLLLFGVCLQYLVLHASSSSDPSLSTPLLHTVHTVTSISLSAVLLCTTLLALLNHSLDPPHTLVINNKLLRLAARPLAILAVLALLIRGNWSSIAFLGVVTPVVWVVLLWEWYAGREAGGGVLESWWWKKEEAVEVVEERVRAEFAAGAAGV